MRLTISQLKERILEKYDPDEIVDLLRISSEELLSAFPHRLDYYRENFSQDEEPENEESSEEDF